MTLAVNTSLYPVSQILEPLINTSQTLWDSGQLDANSDRISNLMPQYLAAAQSLLLFSEQTYRLFDGLAIPNTLCLRKILQILAHRRRFEYDQLAKQLEVQLEDRVNQKAHTTPSPEFFFEQAQYLKGYYKLQCRLFQSAAWSIEALNDLVLAKLFQSWAERLQQDYMFLDAAVERFRKKVLDKHAAALN